MVELIHGNLLEADAEALVNTVNTEGVMGKGVALQFKKAFPEMVETYKKACKDGTLTIGKVQVYTRNAIIGPRYIINFPTKRHWKASSKNEDILKGLKSLVAEVERLRITSIALPALGCGLGGLDWDKVLPMIKEEFRSVPNVRVLVYPPQKSPDANSMINRTERPKMTTLRAKVLHVLGRYCSAGYDLKLLEVQKLLYFLQEAGEPLRLRFKKDYYGPYADNLRHVLHLFEGHFINGFADGKNKPETPIHLIPEAIEEARRIIQKNDTSPETGETILDKVLKLIEGFETPYGMELLATVHWVTIHEKGSSDEDAVLEAVYNWNSRKREVMKPEHVKIARKRLIEHGWIQ